MADVLGRLRDAAAELREIVRLEPSSTELIKAGCKELVRESTLRVIRHAIGKRRWVRWGFERWFADDAEDMANRAIDQVFHEVAGGSRVGLLEDFDG